MLSRIFVLGLVVGAICLVSPCQATIDPRADVLFHPATQGTAEAALTGQIQATTATVVGAHSGDTHPPTPADFYADSHTKVFSNLQAGATGFFSLDQFNPNRFLNNDGVTPVGKLQGVLLYFTIHLKSGRLVFDNESTQTVSAAIVQIGTSLSAWSTDPAVGIQFLTNPRVTKSGSLAGDLTPDGFPDLAHMTQAQIDAASTGPDKLAAIIDPGDPANSHVEQPIYTDLTNATALAAFVKQPSGTGKITFGYVSQPTTSHFAGNQDVIEWAIPPTFDIEARVVYLYAAVPEPASMGLLAAAFVPVLARRMRKRQSPLS